MSNSTGKMKLNYDDVYDMILAKEVCRRDSGEFSGLGLALNVNYRGKEHDRTVDHLLELWQARPHQERLPESGKY